MKRLYLRIALAAFSSGMLISSAALAATPNVTTYNDGDAASGIADSRHNLGAFGAFTRTSDTTEICVFCHTPHHSNTANNLKPLWNRATPASSSMTAYGTTVAGTSIVNTDLGSVTLACLSCHDGVTTFDNLVNSPGKAGVNAGGADQGWTFFFDTSAASDFMTTERLVIGINLSDDHPVSVTYENLGSSIGVASLRPTNTTISAVDLTASLVTSALTYDGGNLTKNLWAVKGYINSTATIADLLRSGRVECSSCHDPHFNNKSWNEIDSTYTTASDPTGTSETGGLFIRRVGGNTGSGVCRTCHAK